MTTTRDTVLGPPLATRVFAVALAVVLAGYMFMGRGFAHLGVGPIYVGDWLLLGGLAAAAVELVRRRARPRLTITTTLLLAFMAWGAVRTIPYLPTYGTDALRDGVLWGYALFALIVLLLFPVRPWLSLAARTYGRVLPVFAVWLPICWEIFRASQVGIDETRPGSNLPLVFFKAGDMAVHAAGAIAFVILAPGLIALLRAALARFLVAIPLTWTVLLTGAASRGALLASATGLAATAVVSRRVLPWAPVLAAALVVVIGLSLPTAIGPFPGPTPSPVPSASLATSPGPSEEPSPAPSPTPGGREVSAGQLLNNVASIFGTSTDSSLDGTKGFRLAWWKAIAGYTVFGPYFWTGKGFGINLADADGFQPTADHSLRAPHNSHMSVLARMGVPGAVLWVLFQAAFAVGLLRAILRLRRRGDPLLAGAAAWVLVMWSAMMVVTSFDPYLEGPQGGIWYWVVVGIGLVLTRAAAEPEPV